MGQKVGEPVHELARETEREVLVSLMNYISIVYFFRQSMFGLISRSPSQSTTSGIDSYDEELFQGIDQLGSTPPSQRL